MARAAKRMTEGGQEEALSRMRGLYAAGNVKAARKAALSIDSQEARELRERSDIDPRALAIGLGALALGIVMVVLAIFLRR